jgi:septal ring factor EnvC (AmiA/AmiB activator)
MEVETDPMKKSALMMGVLLSWNVFSAPSPAGDQLSRHRSQVMQMGARLSSLEKEIGSKNNLYLSSLDQIKQFEGDIKLYKERLIEIQGQLKHSENDNRRILKSYLLEAEDQATESWQRRVHLELLKQAQDRLKERQEEYASLQAKVSEFDAKLAALKVDEEELSKVIGELESRKKVAMEQYMTQVKAKQKIEVAVQTKKLQTKLAEVKKTFSQAPVIEARPDRFFGRPVDDFMAATPSSKGVTFKYQSVQPVKAVGAGKIVFAGDLASYGQVVLIDHGNDLRTVLLGKMDIKVKKNDSVSNGDILAYTQNDSSDAQNLYFEVRKKNTAQNTILWLEPKGISKI